MRDFFDIVRSLCPLDVGGLRIAKLAGRESRRVKSWSRFTSYHLRMLHQLPLALPTVSGQRKLSTETKPEYRFVSRQNTAFLSSHPLVHVPSSTQRGYLFLVFFFLPVALPHDKGSVTRCFDVWFIWNLMMCMCMYI